MNEVRFIWDENKNELNKKKHGISFEEATKVFGDENAILFDDPDHSYDEERFLIIGITGAKGICIVSHYDSNHFCKRSNEEREKYLSERLVKQ